MLVAVVLMILAPIIAHLIYFAISRRREYLADASSAAYTRYPEGLASALEKIAAAPAEQLPGVTRANSPMYIHDPLQAASPSSRAAFSAMQCGSEPSSCGRTGTPASVRLPLSSSGTTRVKLRAGSSWSVTRMNSDTQRSTPPTRVSTSRSVWSSRPSIGARIRVMTA